MKVVKNADIPRHLELAIVRSYLIAHASISFIVLRQAKLPPL